MVFFRGLRLLPLLLLSTLPAGVLGADQLSTTGFSQCVNNPSVKVTNLQVTYNKNTRQLDFNVAGTSKVVQKVKASLVVSAYGKTVYTKDFNPCTTGMKQMCPSKFSRRRIKLQRLIECSTRGHFLLTRCTNDTCAICIADTQHRILDTRSGGQRKTGADE